MSTSLTSSEELEELIDSTVTIPTIPKTLMEINRIFASDEGSAQEAAEAIEKDPAIAAKILRLVNSSFYALKNPISAIPLACSILGLRVIKNLVVQATVLDSFASGPELDEFDTEWLWEHSFKTATAARLIVEKSEADFGIGADDAYTCGLVHDVGKMLLLQNQTEQFAEALKHSKEKGMPLAKAEAELFGFTHAHVGGFLAKRWKLPHELQVAVMYHHSPGANPEDWVQGFLIHAANTIAHQCASGSGGWVGDLLHDDSMQVFSFSEDILSEIKEIVTDTTMS